MEDRNKMQEVRPLLTLGMLYPCKVVSFVTRRGPVTGVMVNILCSSISTASRYGSLRLEGLKGVKYQYLKPALSLTNFIPVETIVFKVWSSVITISCILWIIKCTFFFPGKSLVCGIFYSRPYSVLLALTDTQ